VIRLREMVRHHTDSISGAEAGANQNEDRGYEAHCGYGRDS
jgi:hypothetical protein